MNSVLTLRVAARFQVADQPSGARKDTQEATSPVNKPRGISREVIRDHGKEEKRRDSVKPDKDDLRAKDVFDPTPDAVNMINYVRRAWPGEPDDYKDMERVINKQVPKDEGYETVSNLSQYLIETKGGGGTDPV